MIYLVSRVIFLYPVISEVQFKTLALIVVAMKYLYVGNWYSIFILFYSLFMIKMYNINTDIIKYNINELGMTPTNPLH